MSLAVSRSSETTAPARRSFALGIGLTNECNLACSFCYRDPTRVDRLSLDRIRAVMASLTVRSVNLGTGENGMHPDFPMLLDLYKGGKLDLDGMVTRTYRIDEAPQAFADLEAGRNARGVILYD